MTEAWKTAYNIQDSVYPIFHIGKPQLQPETTAFPKVFPKVSIFILLKGSSLEDSFLVHGGKINRDFKDIWNSLYRTKRD